MSGVKKNVFSAVLKLSKDVELWTEHGNRFHAAGPATTNALPPNFVLYAYMPTNALMQHCRGVAQINVKFLGPYLRPCGFTLGQIRSGRVFIVQLISAIDGAVRFSLQQCHYVSFVVFLLFFHTLLYLLVVDPLQYSPSIFCSVVLLIFSRLSSTDVHIWSVCWPSYVTHAQVILIASV